MSPRLLAAAALCAAAAPASAQNWLDLPLETSTGGKTDLAVDLDLDGDFDLVQQDAFQMIVLRNDGTGSFSAGAATPYATGHLSGGGMGVVGDVDGDGLPDVVLPAVGAVHVYRGQPGPALAPGVAVVPPLGPSFLDLADLDADGTLDVGYSSVSGQGVGWISGGPGGFAAGPSLGVGAFLHTVAAGDWNGDGAADLAVGTAETTQVLVVPTGPTGIGPVTALDLAPPSFASVSVVDADLDADGDLDLLAVARSSDDLHLTPLWGDGAGGFVPGVTTLHAGMEPSFGTLRFHLGDWDADGDLDLGGQTAFAFGGEIRARILRNDGGASFVTALSVPLRIQGVPGGFHDFDGDGHVDFLTSRAILYGDGTFTSQIPLEIFPPDGLLVDREGDGDPDGISTTGTIVTNDGGGFPDPVGEFVLPPLASPFHWRATSGMADLDGDGFGDYVAELFEQETVFDPIVSYGSWLLRDPGTLVLEIAQLAAPQGLVLPGGALPVDLDTDGDVDLLAGGTLWANDGSGFFPGPTPLFPGQAELAAVDVDGNGHQDVLAFEEPIFPPRELVLRRNQGGLVLATETLATASGQFLGRPAFADVDEDGDLDVVAGRIDASSRHVVVIEHVAGSFLPPLVLSTLEYEVGRHAAGDVDGDGLSDLVSASDVYSGAVVPLVVHRRVGPGLAFEAPRAYLARGMGALGDLDFDGDLDGAGRTAFRSRAFGAEAGSIRQYGAGSPGSGGAVPVLGAKGPVKPGSSDYELRVRRGLGGAPSLLLVGSAEVHLPGVPLGGLTLLVGGTLHFPLFTLGGTPGAPAQGTLDLPVPVGPALVGSTWYHQLFSIDPGAPHLVSASNGLEVRFGT